MVNLFADQWQNLNRRSSARDLEICIDMRSLKALYGEFRSMLKARSYKRRTHGVLNVTFAQLYVEV